MKINCLMGTYGRYHLACESLACFLQQTAIDDAVLLVFNQHPIPLHFDHPRVRVINEEMPGATIRTIKARMHELADPAAEFFHWWDDDDLFLPWHLEDCLRHIGVAQAWKPRRSWVSDRGNYTLMSNNFEGSTLFRADVTRSVPLDAYPTYMDHPAVWHLLKTKQVQSTEFGDLASYIYRWGTGAPHVSSHVRKNQEEYVVVIDELRKRWVDAGPTELVIPDLWPHWQAFLDGIQKLVSEASHDELFARLALADARSKLGAGGGT